LEILDIFGKTVKTLIANEAISGTRPYSWNGTDANGFPVVDGHYLYRLTTGTEVITKKMSFIRAK
jgi:flagellar hook assembly protein FlgD